MPIVVKLGLPLDRSLFGFRKTDRSATVSSPVLSPSPSSGPAVELSISADSLATAPELPPLHALNFKSFVNLLNHVEISPSPSTAVKSKRTTTVETLTTSNPSAASVPDNLPLHDAMSLDNMGSLEFMTTGTYFSTMAPKTPTKIPARQQSSVSSASASKHSDTDYSDVSVSSRSSVDDTPLKKPSFMPLGLMKIEPIDTDFLDVGYEVRKLDTRLKHSNSSGSSNQSVDSPTSPLDTNKPLPPAPTATSRNSKVGNGKSMPELESGPVAKTQNNKTASTSKYVGPSKSSGFLVGDDEKQVVPPRKSAHKSKTHPQTSKRNSKQKSILVMADQVILQILLRVQTITDLKSMSMTNKRFYRAFKRNETEVVESVLKNASPAAWELRQLVQREQKRSPYQIKAVQRDLAALRALQAFMLMRCGKLCRPSTVEGLMGDNTQRRADIENALWRIWTFCKLFGKGTSRDAGTHAQIMWLEGTTLTENGDKYKLQPNKRAIPPSKVELEDMCEMWRCMELLLSNFRGREPEAREAGIFEQCQFDEKDGRSETSYLEDWIYDILSVGPKAVLTMISCSFEHAKVLGVNKWTPPRQGRSRRTFLKAALEQVYRDRLVEEARIEANSFSRSVQQQQIQQTRAAADANKKQQHKSQQPQAQKKHQTPNIKSRSEPNLAETVDVPTSQPLHRSASATPVEKATVDKAETKALQRAKETRLEIRPDCDPDNSLADLSQLPSNSPTTNPASFSSLAMMSLASARLGATLFPMQHTKELTKQESSDEVSEMDDSDSIDLSIEPKVVDPSDRALSVLVKQLGFPENLAKQALAMSDDGAGIDIQRAVELLSNDRRLGLDSSNKEIAVAELPGALPNGLTAGSAAEMQQLKEFCEGTCKRPSLVTRKKSTFRGLMNRSSIRQSFRLSVILDQEDEEEAVQQFVKDTIAPNTAATNSSKSQSKPSESTPSETKPPYHNLTEFMKYRNSTRLSSGLGRTNSFLRGHRKSSSAGTADSSEDDANRPLSPVSPMTPIHCLGGFTAVKPQPQFDIINSKNSERNAQITTRPKVTLTRVGTGKKPSRRMSFGKNGGSIKPGEPPEIIGYTY